MGHEPAVLHRRPSRCEGQGGIACSGGQHALDDRGSETIHKTGRGDQWGMVAIEYAEFEVNWCAGQCARDPLDRRLSDSGDRAAPGRVRGRVIARQRQGSAGELVGEAREGLPGTYGSSARRASCVSD